MRLRSGGKESDASGHQPLWRRFTVADDDAALKNVDGLVDVVDPMNLPAVQSQMMVQARLSLLREMTRLRAIGLPSRSNPR